MERGPFCYTDPVRIKDDLLAAGFTHVEIETIQLSSRVNSRDAAQGFVFGSPFRSEIERRDPSALDRAAEAVAQALPPDLGAQRNPNQEEVEEEYLHCLPVISTCETCKTRVESAFDSI